MKRESEQLKNWEAASERPLPEDRPNNRLCQNRSRKKAGFWGFSLVELLVALFIVAALAGFSIPSYMNHAKKVARMNMINITNGIAKSILSCAAANSPPPANAQFNSCKTLEQIEGDLIEGLTAPRARKPKVCLQLERRSGGEVYQACLMVNTKTGKAVRKFNVGLCHRETAGGCAAAASMGLCVPTAVKCQADSDCPLPGSMGITRRCLTGSMGACSASAECV